MELELGGTHLQKEDRIINLILLAYSMYHHRVYF